MVKGEVAGVEKAGAGQMSVWSFLNCRAKLYCTEMHFAKYWLVVWFSDALMLWYSGSLMLWCCGVLMFWCTDALVVWCWFPSALVLWCRWSRWQGWGLLAESRCTFFGLLLLYFAVLACARNSRPWHLTATLMLWSTDALMHWCTSALVHWCAGALKPGGQWQIGKEPNGLPAAWADCCLLVVHFLGLLLLYYFGLESSNSEMSLSMSNLIDFGLDYFVVLSICETLPT